MGALVSALREGLARIRGLLAPARLGDDGRALPPQPLSAGAKRAAALLGLPQGGPGGKRQRVGGDASLSGASGQPPSYLASADAPDPGDDDDDEVAIDGESAEEAAVRTLDVARLDDLAAAATALAARRDGLAGESTELAAQLAELRATRDRTAAQRGVFTHVRSVASAQAAVATLRERASTLQAAIDTKLATVALGAGEGGATVGTERLLADAQHELRGVEIKSATLEGALSGTRDALERTRRELAEKEMRDAHTRFTAGKADKDSLEALVRDLGATYSAVDSALMRYHHLKLSEINTIIKDLWAHTYQGNDIDNIEIRSDLDDAAAAAAAESSAKASRSYNYRVVMTKGESELDMRGRCSAGQKVLASIVIRLALAESFCVNTGLLALDEPTTNLDAHNKTGLARALARIIEMRPPGSLQLVVITHDEEFVGDLGRSLNEGGGSASKAQLGTYYRVFREEVRPGVFHSRIELQELGVV